MKTYILFFFFVMALSPLRVFAQTDREDVIYMKNGGVYRGTIIEQIPSVSYKIEIAGGSVIFVKAEEVIRITKEPKASTGEYYFDKWHRSEPRAPRPKPEYKFLPKGYFLQAQVLGEALELGFRIVNGYKFGRFGYLGLGVGVDGVILDIHGTQNYSGAYFPVYIHYGGDILKKQTTPFYSVEAGYAFHPTPGGGDLSPASIFGTGSGNIATGSKGGLMAGAGFGIRFHTRYRVHFDLSGHFDIKQTSSTFTGYDNSGDPYNYSMHTILLIPGIRFGVGF